MVDQMMKKAEKHDSSDDSDDSGDDLPKLLIRTTMATLLNTEKLFRRAMILPTRMRQQ